MPFGCKQIPSRQDEWNSMKNFALLAVFTMASIPSSSIQALSMLALKSAPDKHVTIQFMYQRHSVTQSVCVFSHDGTCFGAELWCHSHFEGGKNRRVITCEDVICATWQETNSSYYIIISAITTRNALYGLLVQYTVRQMSWCFTWWARGEILEIKKKKEKKLCFYF